MKVILVNGSPNQNGSTYHALLEVEKTLNEEGVETQIYWIGNKVISSCMGCHACSRLGKCCIEDNVNEFIELAKNADGFVFGTPVHYAGISGGLKSFMDRVFYSASSTKRAWYFSHKPVSSVIVARRAGTTAAYDQINKYFGITQMPIISSRYWNMVHGAKPEDIHKDAEGMQIMRITARNMAYFLKCIEAGKEKGVLLPAREKTILTNFVDLD